MSNNITARAFRDSRIDQGEALHIFLQANQGHTVRPDDDQAPLAANVATELARASGGRLDESDVQELATTIVRELYDSFNSSATRHFDEIASPFGPTAFGFPDQARAETSEGAVAKLVRGRGVPVAVRTLETNTAARHDFLQRCTQLDGRLETTLDRNDCTVMSTLGGYLLADPARVQQLGRALRSGPVPQFPGFAAQRDQDRALREAVQRIAGGHFSPADVTTLGMALANSMGVHAPDYETGGGGGASVYRTAVLIERLIAVGAPPPEGLALVGVNNVHQIARVDRPISESQYFDSSASMYQRDDHPAYYATVTSDSAHLPGSLDGMELALTEGGTRAVLRNGPNDQNPVTMRLVDGQFQVEPGTGSASDVQALARERGLAHPPARR